MKAMILAAVMIVNPAVAEDVKMFVGYSDVIEYSETKFKDDVLGCVLSQFGGRYCDSSTYEENRQKKINAYAKDMKLQCIDRNIYKGSTCVRVLSTEEDS